MGRFLFPLSLLAQSQLTDTFVPQLTKGSAMSEIDETVEPEVDQAPKPKKAAKKAAPKSDAPAGLPHYLNSSRT